MLGPCVWAGAKAARSDLPFVDAAGDRTFVTVAADADMDTVVMESAISVEPEPGSSLTSVLDVGIGPLQEAKQTVEQAV